jgi:hypothetical protein
MAQPDQLPDAGNGRPWRVLRRGKRKGRGPGGPEAHREPAGDVGLAGDGLAVMNLAGEELHFRRGIRDGGGD